MRQIRKHKPEVSLFLQLHWHPPKQLGYLKPTSSASVLQTLKRTDISSLPPTKMYYVGCVRTNVVPTRWFRTINKNADFSSYWQWNSSTLIHEENKIHVNITTDNNILISWHNSILRHQPQEFWLEWEAIGIPPGKGGTLLSRLIHEPKRICFPCQKKGTWLLCEYTQNWILYSQ